MALGTDKNTTSYMGSQERRIDPGPPTNRGFNNIETVRIKVEEKDLLDLLKSNPNPVVRNRDYTVSSNSFSGADVKVLFSIPATGKRRIDESYMDVAEGFPDHSRPGVTADLEAVFMEVNNLQTLSYSIFREKSPVRSLGIIGEKGRTRGTRTIAGSLVFTVFDRHVLWDIMRIGQGDSQQGKGSVEMSFDSMEYVVPDQLPPFDIIVHFVNEYGYAAELVLFGVELHQEGQTMSIQDMITENVMQFTARHIAIMRPGGYRPQAALWDFSTPEKTFTSILNGGSNSEKVQNLIRASFNRFR